MNQELLKQQIVGAFLNAKGKNAKYSKRAFARKLGISHGPLVEIMSGKRNISIRMAKKLSENLLLSPKQMDLIFSNPKKKGVAANEEVELKEDHFNLISDYNHFALLNLITIKNQSHSPKELANRLGSTEDKIKLMIQRLCRLKMIEIKAGRIIRAKVAFKTTDEVSSLSIKASHRALLEKCSHSLDNTPLELHDFSSITMAINTKKLKAAKNLLKNFQDELASLLVDGKADEVYTLNMQLIPMSHKGGQ